jgi:hypothetical protein
MRQKSVRAELGLKNPLRKRAGIDDSKRGEMAAARHQTEACMLGQGWPEEWLVDLRAREKAGVEACMHSGKPMWLCL